MKEKKSIEFLELLTDALTDQLKKATELNRLLLDELKKRSTEK